MFNGKTVLITGSNRGIGRAATEAFAAEGASVLACARKQTPEFEADMAGLAEKYDVEITPVYFDLADEEAVKNAIKQIATDKKRIDVLVNNAGVAFGGLMTMTPISKLKEVFQINYFSQILMMQQVSKLMMRQKSGVIINMASVGGIETNAGYLAYGSSKAALIWATRCVSKELAPYGIRVNAVAPGLTKTEMGLYKSEEELNKVVSRSSLKRLAKPEEIAQGILFLASERSSFTTGTILTIDGGRL